MESRDREGFWDCVLINDNLEDTYQKLRAFLVGLYSL
jgi:hypothetical protein